jgi:hypothetical protein
MCVEISRSTQGRAGFVRAAFSSFLIFGVALRVGAQPRFEFPTFDVSTCSVERSAFLSCVLDEPISAYSISVRFAPDAVDVVSVSLEGTSILTLYPSGPQFFAGNFSNDELVYGVVLEGLSGSDPSDNPLPIGSHTLMRVDFRPAGAPTVEDAIEFIDRLDVPGTARSRNVVTSVVGVSIVPEMVHGRIRVVRDDISVSVGLPSHSITAGQRVQLSASGGSSCEGPISYSWTQVAGPPVLEIDGETTRDLSFTVPPVEGDSGLEFSVTVSNGSATAEATARITVLDPASRRAEFALIDVATNGVDIDDSGLRVALGARVAWTAATEDGIWNSLRLRAIGNAADFAGIDSTSLYIDVDADGRVGPLDRQAARLAGVPVDDEGRFQFHLAEMLSSGRPVAFLVTIDTTSVGAAARLPFALVVTIVLAFVLRRGTPSRTVDARGRFVGSRGLSGGALGIGVLAIAAGFLVLPSCSSGGSGGGAGDPAPREKSIQLIVERPEDVVLTSLISEIPGVATNLPITGPKVILP